MRERGGCPHAKLTPDTSKKTMHRASGNMVEFGMTVYTDCCLTCTRPPLDRLESLIVGAIGKRITCQELTQ